MTTRTALREEFYANLLDEAPKAIRDWAYSEFDDERSTLEIREFGDDPDEVLSEHTITIDSIATGWQRLLKLEADGKWWHCQNAKNPIAATERALQTKNGEEDYDDCVIDAVVQLATLGEVRYS